MPLSRVATREHQDRGFREDAAFFDLHGERVFGVTYTPHGGASFGVVVCCSVLVEFLTNYRIEVLLARQLASMGLAVHRFHYRGAGHSTGEEAELTLQVMADDAIAAARRLQEQTGVKRLGFVGTRWGAMVAAQASREFPASPLLFWAPTTEADSYIRELVRSRRVRDLKDARALGNTWKTEMSHRGYVDILGYALYPALVESSRGARLEALVGERPGPALIYQLGGSTVWPEIAGLKTSLEARGSAVDVRLIRDEPAWLFPGHVYKSSETLIAGSAAWMAAMAQR
jgi:pimeloyl-ACP methyl ester carboxylesterase